MFGLVGTFIWELGIINDINRVPSSIVISLFQTDKEKKVILRVLIAQQD